MTDARNFLLNTDYPIDKISGYYEGSETVLAGGTSAPTVTHGLGYRPLYFMKWSTTPDFSISYDELGVSTINNLSFNAQTSNTTLFLFAGNNTASTVTFYYRVVYFMPPDVDLDAPITAPDLESLQFSTDFNYTKIFAEGINASATGTINHNLGYYPQVEVWYIRASDSRCVHVVATQVYSVGASEPVCEVTTSSIILSDPGGIVSSWYYKVYVDET